MKCTRPAIHPCPDSKCRISLSKSHDTGAIYGAPEKQLDGRSHLDHLFVCGTDQGFVGIIGSVISGIGMANQHCLLD